MGRARGIGGGTGDDGVGGESLRRYLTETNNDRQANIMYLHLHFNMDNVCITCIYTTHLHVCIGGEKEIMK